MLKILNALPWLLLAFMLGIGVAPAVQVGGAGVDSGEVNPGSDTGGLLRLESTITTATFGADPGAQEASTTGAILPGVIVVGISWRVTTGNTGGCTSFDAGIEDKDEDAFADAQAVTLGVTGTHDGGNAAAQWGYDQDYPTSLDIMPSMVPQEILVSANGGDGACDDLVITFVVYYLHPTAQTS